MLHPRNRTISRPNANCKIATDSQKRLVFRDNGCALARQDPDGRWRYLWLGDIGPLDAAQALATSKGWAFVNKSGKGVSTDGNDV